MTIAGTWENEYGSRMTLAVRGGEVFGIYESTTGSIGQYCVAGWQSAEGATADFGQPVALAIAWQSLVDGPADPSWSWVSALCGQISMVGGKEMLVLNHLLVATSAFPGLCESGTYSDKLTYCRMAGGIVKPACQLGPSGAGNNALAGAWSARDGTMLQIRVTPEAGGGFGILSGKLILASRELDIAGFTDSNALLDQHDRQSVAIAAVDIATNVTMTLAGWIDPATRELYVQAQTSRATSPSSIYLQTAISSLNFRYDGTT